MSSDQKKVLPKLVPSKHLCCGCGACATVCPKKTIAMVANNEGFLFPQVVEALSVRCFMCEPVCAFKADIACLK